MEVNKLKNHIAFAALIVLSIFTIGISRPVFGASFVDVKNTEYEKAVSFLEAFNVLSGYEDGTFGSDKNLTRAEFAAMTYRLMNLEEISGTGAFSDVPSSYWASKEIHTLFGMEILKGVSGSVFEPEGAITYSQILSVLINALGYGPYADARGGYPAGYHKVAREIGIAQGIAGGETPASRGEAAILLYKAAGIALFEVTSVGLDIKYGTMGNTLLSRYHDVYAVEGVITAADNICLDGGKLRAGDIRIDGETYRLSPGAEYAAGYLGCRVEAYYRLNKSSSLGDIVYVYPKEQANDILTIDGGDIVSFDRHVITYERQGRLLEAKLEPSAVVLVNGEVRQSYSEADFLHVYGSVTLISGSSSYRYAYVKNYRNYVVSKVNAADFTVYNEYDPDKSFILAPNRQNIDYFLRDMYGQDISLAEIHKGDVLSVLESREYLAITWISERISGKITEISDDRYLVDGREVLRGVSLTRAIDNGIVSKPFVGSEVVFALDIKGNAAGVLQGTVIRGQIAFLINAEKPLGLDDRRTFVFMLPNKSVQYIEAAQKVKYEKGSMSETIKATALYDNLLGQDGRVERQVVIITQNAENKLTGIEVAAEEAQKTEGKLYRYAISGRTYKSAPMSIEGVTSFSADTVVFTHPADGAARDPNEDYGVKGISSFVNDSKPEVMIYGKHAGTIPAIAATMVIDASISAESALMLVGKISEVLDKDGVKVTKITGVQNGSIVSVLLKDDAVYGEAKHITAEGEDVKISEGDLIRLGKDGADRVVTLEIVYDYETGSSRPWNNTPVYNAYLNIFHLLRGKVSVCDGKYLRIEMIDGAYENHLADKAQIMVYDSGAGANRVRIGTLDDIVDARSSSGSEIVIRSRYGELRDLVIYK